MGRVIVIILLSFTLGCSAAPPSRALTDTTQAPFVSLMNALAAAWNQGDARTAASLFTHDAVYSQPPDRQLHEGREALFHFFGGDQGRPGQMSMIWHHLAYDQRRQIGFGEFSFTYGSTAHGVAVVKLRDGKIAHWREYWYESALDWEHFTRQNPF